MNNQILHHHLTQMGMKFEFPEVEDEFLKVVQVELSRRHQFERYKPDFARNSGGNTQYASKTTEELLHELCKEIYHNKYRIKGINEFSERISKCGYIQEPIEDLNLSIGSYRALKRANINTISDLLLLKESDLKKIRNFGRKKLQEIIDKAYHWQFCIRPSLTFEDFDETVTDFCICKNINESLEMKTSYDEANRLILKGKYAAGYQDIKQLAEKEYFPAQFWLANHSYKRTFAGIPSIDCTYDLFKWSTEASKYGFGYALLLLAWCYGTGTGTKKDEKLAYELCLKAAEQDIGYAQCQIANCYRYGLGVEANLFKEDEWLKKAEDSACFKGIELFHRLKRQGESEHNN